MLVLDTYEKVSPIIDTWLWRTLLGNTDVMQQPVWLVIAGRHNIRQEIGWSTLHQDTNCIHECTFKRFNPEQTKDYLAQIDISNEADIRNIYQVTKGLPYYLNWVRSQFEKGLTLNFAEGQQEIEQLLVKWMTPAQRQVAQLAACCRQFDRALIRSLTDFCELDFATAADDTRNCFGWLTAQSFVEPVGHRWRVDDVAREVFRQGLRQVNREQFEQIYGQLADYYQHRAGSEVSPQASLPERYENPDWREPYAEHLYYLSFSRRPDFQTQFLSHLLEARFFRVDQSIQEILQALLAEGALADQPAYLSHATRRFLQEIAPAVFYGWAVLEEVPLDYAYNQDSYGLTKAATDKALQQCLSHPEQFEGLAKFMAFLCKAKRCAQMQQQGWLLKAQAQAQALEKLECKIKSSDFLIDLYLWKLGDAFYSSNFYEEAIACYDAALAIKPDKHEALYNKGNSLDDLGRREEAIACYDAALAIKPDKHEALSNKGVSLDDLGRREEAIACYDAALAIKPDDHTALSNKGVSLDDLGRREEAIACYDAALSIKPDKHEALYNKACCYSLQGDTDNALRFLQDAIALDAKYQNMAQTDTDFDAIRQDPRFQNLIKTVS
ncbi:MAG: hypothetical protein DCF15_21040 [Phormidesmis priestleyi]|uniref:Uncharacterized protein n=1 Tax=Phormidesmis priestleyi TaxID=268141 RepID=A0A2W4WVL6_9CYAN|nr:MAG: hypothetical protein DCF15_21040 [Phormidesmis priestleyi]